VIYGLPLLRTKFWRYLVAALGTELPTYPEPADVAAAIGPVVCTGTNRPLCR
jgi:hypothetical protein